MLATRNIIPEMIEVGTYLVADPRMCFGKLTFKGTRVPVNTVLTFLCMGDSIDDILESWPYLKREAIEEAVRLAAVAWPELMRAEKADVIRKLAKRLAPSKYSTA